MMQPRAKAILFFMTTDVSFSVLFL